MKYGIHFTEQDARNIQEGLWHAAWQCDFTNQEAGRKALIQLYHEIAAVTGIFSDQDDQEFPDQPNEKLKRLLKTKAPWE